MISYRQQYQPAFQPRLAQAPLVQPTPVIPAPTAGQRQLALALGAGQTAFGVVATWTGVRMGLRDKGPFRILGWATAVGGGLFTAINLMGTLGTLATPAQ